jgi:hypothetical protein
MSAPAATLNRRSQSFVCQRIGADHNHKCGIGARIHRGFYAVHHFFRGHNLFAGPVAAAFRAHLIFNMNGSCSGLLHRADGPRNVKRASPARIYIHKQRKGHNIGNAANVSENVFHAADAQIRQPQRVGRHAAA